MCSGIFKYIVKGVLIMSDKSPLVSIDSRHGAAEDNYEKQSHFIGRITLSAGFLLSVLPPLMLWLVYGIFPPIKSLIEGIVSITVIMLPVSIVEVLTFAPMMGSAAMYLSYLTGNISNLKIPSAAISIEAASVQPSTRQGDIIATIAITGSVIASTLVLVLGFILIVPVSAYMENPAIKPAFEQILPALFGSIGAYYILKEWKLAVAPVIAAISLNLAGDLPTAITIPVCIAISVLAARFLHKRKLVKGADSVD